ncbi:hypothetical protein BGW36DRAFT_264975, partial [Talaromyces proteolyticus]
MSSKSRAPGLERGGSVKRAREMLKAGMRPQYNDESNKPPSASHSEDVSEGEINIGYQVDSDHRDPVPAMPIQGLHVVKHTGPPPTSRRGPSSLYSRHPFVSPIPEESPQWGRSKKKGSFASSAAIPSSWGSDGPVSDGPVSDILNFYDSGNDSDGDRDPSTLVRHASLGKRGKPALRTISKPQSGVAAGEKSMPSGPVRDEQDQSSGHTNPGNLKTRPSFESASTDTDSIDLEKRRIAIEAEQDAMNGGLAAVGPGMSSKKRNRPPKLDLGAVRDAEARGSLTSLPDLIRRATRVASNLEHGRTASKMGLLDFFDGGKEPKRPKPAHARSSASLSDILASFPPPRTGTPDDGVRSSWPFPPGRRICGLSLPLFVTLSIIAFFIIAAAVIIPIVLVVLPRSTDNTVSTASPANITNNSTTIDCGQILPCKNSGVSVLSNNSCSCVCVDGFSGSQCGNATDGSCTTTQISQTVNATVGTSLPHIFADSQSNFSIPLNSTEILSLFNAQNVSCTVQNALVFFNTKGSKSQRSSATENQEPQITKASRSDQVRRDNGDSSSLDAPPPILSVPSTTTSTTKIGGPMSAWTSTSTSQPTATTSTSTSTASGSTSTGLSQHIFDFARVAVLFILEQTQNVDTASTARSDIALSLLSKSDAPAGSMKVVANKQESFVLNFANFTITLPNGTVVG